MANDKPLVQAACICDRAVVEKDDVVSIIRMVDIFGLDIEAHQTSGKTPAFRCTVFIALKSGDVRGEHVIHMALRRPDGKVGDRKEFPLILNGGNHGANFVIDLRIPSPVYGLYWFDVIWSDQILTSIPFELKKITRAETKS